MLNWIITLFLLILVGAFFVFSGGTVGVFDSLLGRITAVSSVAGVFAAFAVFRWLRTRHSKAGSTL